MTAKYSQEKQWDLLTKWYTDPSPSKKFDSFLRRQGYPCSNFEDDGLYYMQICRKFWYASRAHNQLEFIKKHKNQYWEEADNNDQLNNTLIIGSLCLVVGYTIGFVAATAAGSR